MAKLGYRPIRLPNGVAISQADQKLTVTGPKGSLTVVLPAQLGIKQADSQLTIKTNDDSKTSLSLQGLTRSLLAGAIKGVTEGFERRLEMKGTGFRAEVKEEQIILSVGFSHPIVLTIPEGVAAKVERNIIIVLQGINKQRLGEFAAKIRAIRPPEPYKGKGIKYGEEVIKRKPGKAAKAAVTAA